MVDRRKTGWRKPPDYEGEPLTEDEIKAFTHYAKPFDQCVGCEEYLIDIHREYNEYAIRDGNYSEKAEGFVCHPCKESDDYHKNTVVIFEPEQGTVKKYTVGEYFDDEWSGPDGISSDELEGLEFYPDGWGEPSPIQFRYVSTDAWRGYHTPIIPEGWHQFHSDCILSWSADAEELKEFDAKVRRMLWDEGITFALCFGLTSNVFSTGYDLLVEASEDILKTLKIIMKLEQLKTEHRDPARFRRTALTGSDEDTKEARLLVKAADMLDEGRDFEEVKEIILVEARRDV